MVILGVDPGIATVGYGVVSYENRKFTPLDYGAILTPAHTPLPDRLESIYDSLKILCTRFSADVMSVEELFFNTNVKTAIAVGHGRGVILLCAKKMGIDVFEYTPLQVKQAVVGYGRADKNQVQQMVKMILGLCAIPKPDDAADALAMAICHGYASTSAMGKKEFGF